LRDGGRGGKKRAMSTDQTQDPSQGKKLALVTGASRGLGGAIAEALASISASSKARSASE